MFDLKLLYFMQMFYYKQYCVVWKAKQAILYRES